MFEPETAPSATLLGLLQRGRGDGTLHALAAERGEALAALDACVTHDPRRDWQVENRSLYYARLYMELEGPLAGLEAHLFHTDDLLDCDEARTGLTLSVLGRLARYGRRDALLLLRRYAAGGTNWAWALDELAVCDDDAGLLALAAPVLARFPEDAEGEAALRSAVREAYEPRPWHLWAERHRRVAAATEQAPFALWQRQLARPAQPPGWSTAAVLAWADEVPGEPSARPGGPAIGPAGPAAGSAGGLPGDPAGSPHGPSALERRAAAAARCLKAVAGPGDRALLLRAARDGADGARIAALRHLADLDDPAVPELLELAATDSSDVVVSGALGTLCRMRGARIMERARSWAAAPLDSALADASVRLLAAAGDERDAPLVAAALRRRLAVGGVDAHGLGALVEGAARLRATAAVPVLRLLYAETASSVLRGLTARALAATDPCFGSGAAVECLWDCEESTRELAARHVETNGNARVLDRLRRLAADPAEEAQVHDAVRGRLTGP